VPGRQPGGLNETRDVAGADSPPRAPARRPESLRLQALDRGRGGGALRVPGRPRVDPAGSRTDSTTCGGSPPVTARAAPLATIALLTYNRSRLLARALESARQQDYPQLEILVLDNASTDGTESLCRAAAGADPRIRYVRQPRNLGAIGNFNAALELARGRYFMWLADDDWITANYVSACVAVLEADPSVALAAGRAQWPDEAPAKRFPSPMNIRGKEPQARVLQYLWDPGRNSIFYGVHRLELVRQVGYRKLLAGDWLTVAAVATQGALVTIAEATVFCSSGGASRSHHHAARSLGLPRWQGYAPKIAIAASTAAYFRAGYPFGDLDTAAQRRLAARVFLVLAARKKALRWLLWFVPRELRPAR
jgi:Glycosyl transferase family 2